MHGLNSGPVPAQGEVGDVDAVLAENGSDAADDAGHVDIAAHQQGALERRLHVDAVELEQPWLLSMDHSGGGMTAAGGRMEFDSEQRSGPAAEAVLLVLVDTDAALLSDGGGVDAVDVLRPGEQPGDGRVAHEVGLGIG